MPAQSEGPFDGRPWFGGHAGKLIEWTKAPGGWTPQVVRRCDDVEGFVVPPGGAVADRTSAWLGRYRRLGKDFEARADDGEALIRLAMISLMVHRLKPG